MALKYKAGDQVRIKSIDWYNKNINNNGIIICGSESFTHPMSHFCDKVVTIVTIQDDCYRILEDGGDWYWTDEMIEGLVEPIDCKKCGLTRMSTRCLFMDNCPHNQPKHTIEIPKGWIPKDENGNVINATKIVLEKKKKEYPKTFEECCKVLGLLNVDLCFNADYRSFDASKEQWKRLGLMNQFYQLLICRDAYWKLYGDEMGLGKSWEPDWDTNENELFVIANYNGTIVKTGWYYVYTKILVFPTSEMRDAFYEAFKEEIEICKELL